MKTMLNKIINWIKTTIKRIVEMFNKRKKRKTNTTHKAQDNDFGYNNADWGIVDHTGKTNNLKIIESESDNDDTGKSMTDIYYMSKVNELIIIMPLTADYSKNCQYCTTDKNKHLTLVKDNDFMCLYPTLSLLGKVVKIFTGHTYMMIQNQSNIDPTFVNPQILVTPKTKVTLPMQKVSRKKLATIMTMDINNTSNYVLETVPSTFVDVQYKVKGKPKIGTIALIFTINIDTDMIWSGSIVRYDNAVFIMSNTTHYEETGVIKLVAFAVATHDIKIITQNAFE